jgi:hypothetical protein
VQLSHRVLEGEKKTGSFRVLNLLRTCGDDDDDEENISGGGGVATGLSYLTVGILFPLFLNFTQKGCPVFSTLKMIIQCHHHSYMINVEVQNPFKLNKVIFPQVCAIWIMLEPHYMHRVRSRL